jgi:ATP-dependent Clp protease ATP-binding subunit ClpX
MKNLTPPKPPMHPIYCSWCGKSETEVIDIVKGPCVFICNECLVLCLGIMVERRTLDIQTVAKEVMSDV